jgi:hypothetical protein
MDEQRTDMRRQTPARLGADCLSLLVGLPVYYVDYKYSWSVGPFVELLAMLVSPLGCSGPLVHPPHYAVQIGARPGLLGSAIDKRIFY